jgi:hypothetical protein
LLFLYCAWRGCTPALPSPSNLYGLNMKCPHRPLYWGPSPQRKALFWEV